MPKWTLRFDATECPALSDRYAYYADDTEALRIGEQAKARGRFTYEEFLAVCLWKTNRSKSRCRKNTPEDVEEVTQLALSVNNERLRMASLRCLHGVDWPTASVLLHMAHFAPYPILDVRALWSLGFEKQPGYTFELWWRYVQACRQLASQTGLSMRGLDRALWQYSKEHQPLTTG